MKQLSPLELAEEDVKTFFKEMELEGRFWYEIAVHYVFELRRVLVHLSLLACRLNYYEETPEAQ